MDTHALLWFDLGIESLGPVSRKLIQETSANGEAAVASISFWEIAMLNAKDRISLREPLSEWRQSLLADGLAEIPLCGAIGIVAGGLTELHGDPADRIIMATAMRRSASLLTADRALLAWTGEVECIDARQ